MTATPILAWEILWTEGRGAWWATIHGVARVGHNLMTKAPTLQGSEEDRGGLCMLFYGLAPRIHPLHFPLTSFLL